MEVFCKPPGNPRGLFFGDARGVQGKQRRSSRTQLCKRAQNDAGTCNACKLGLEGIVFKRLWSRYQSGRWMDTTGGYVDAPGASGFRYNNTFQVQREDA